MKPIAIKSIRGLLLVGLLGGLLTAGVAATAITYWRTRSETNELFDYQLRQMALSLRNQRLAQPDFGIARDDDDFIVQIWQPDGVRIYLSHPGVVLPDQVKLGYDTVTFNDESWRVFSIQTPASTVQVAQPMRIRRELAQGVALRVLTPFLWLLPVLAALIWITIGAGLRPLKGLAQSLEKRTPLTLQPFSEMNLPAEVMPMVRSLNGLLQRLADALSTQRQFVADAAHELRTPITAVQLQIQLLERAKSEKERDATLRELKAGMKRCAHLVEQLLSLARSEPDARQQGFAPLQLAETVKASIAHLTPLAQARRIDLGLNQADDVAVNGDAAALRVLCENLIDNAVRYAPEGGRVDVEVVRQDDVAQLTVTDNGPGIPVEERERIFDRFYRLPDSSTQGSGLGLAIVKNIADQHGAAIVFEESPYATGLKAVVRFPILRT